ncbi:helix-turn-helix domain-containing protein [uncultured Campylobacter sp.]|uniref:helix-turn-helix transcriptional regulator n=1 Tax=uncultured Campylobacter sp. TaxID=218934 RepID=UPI002605134F|nr:helix-turn-helix domain-containing protein [uncultured Campylobacter sp.]
MIGQEYLTTRQAKELLGGVCDATLWRYVKEGYIEKFKLGKKTVVYTRASIEKFIQNAVKTTPARTA